MIDMRVQITPQFLKQQGWSETLPKRFWQKVRKDHKCWIWTGHTDRFGYGKMWSGRESKGQLTHRVSWIIHNGAIPNGLYVLHNCPNGDNPSCVNPKHLWLGTYGENILDALRKGRWKTKLSENDVKEIRRRFSKGDVSETELANEFGVVQGNISLIVHNKTWLHVH